LFAAGLVLPTVVHADVTLNFVNADIDQVAKAIGLATGQTVVVDPRVKGQLNLVSDQPVDDAKAIATLQAALRMQGYSLLQDHGILKVVPESDAKLQGVPTYQGNTPVASGDQMITQVFQLHYESANNLVSVLRPLIAPNNAITAYPANNTLVVTDYAGNVRRIASIIASIDVAQGQSTDIVQLQYADASDVASEVQKVLDPGAIGDTDSTLKVSVQPDLRTNSLILRASSASRLHEAEGLIAKLDAPTRELGNIHVVGLHNADATQLAKTLRGMMGQSSGDDSSSSSSAQKSFNQGNSVSGSATSSSSGNSSGSSSASLEGGSTGGALPPLPGSVGGSSASNSSNDGGKEGDSGSRGGMIQADSATNSLVITASEPVYRNLRRVIEQLDVRRAQIYIESMIVELSSDHLEQLGINWQSLNDLDISVLHKFAQNTTLGSVLQALETNSDVNVLSTPNLITLDNEEARIIAGQNIPVLTGSYTSTGSSSTVTPYQTYDREDVGITLHVRPQITEDGLIKMQIYTESSSVVSNTTSNSSGPTINKRAVQSTVLIDNGSIVVLGGLIQDQYTNGNSRLPWLGSLPVIGNLFSTENKERTKTDLMIFLRPIIVRDGQTQNALSQNRYDYVRGVTNAYQSSNILIRDSQIPAMPVLRTGGDAPALAGSLVPTQQSIVPVPASAASGASATQAPASKVTPNAASAASAQ